MRLSSIWNITSHLSRDYDVGGMVTGMVTGAMGKKDIKSATGNIDTATNLAYDRGAMTPQESSQYSGSFDIGNVIKQILMYQQGLGPAPAGYQNGVQQYKNQTGELGSALYDTALADVKDPYATYESQLQPALKASQDFVNADMQKRGLLSSGLNIENMGRAGVDLAIQEAQQRMTYRADALNRGASMSDAVQNTQSNNLANLSNLYNQQQSYGQNAQSRQAGQALGILPTAVQPFQAQLGYGYGQLAAGQKAVTKSTSAGINAVGSSATGGTANLGSSFFPA